MRSLARLITSWVAIYAVALHAILLGLVPIAANGDSVAPVPAICHGVTPGDDSSGQPDFVPGHACEHCNVCSTAAPPEPALGPVADLLPSRLLHILRPASQTSHAGIAFRANLARAPPRLA